jgi:hypothetical protein
MSNIFKSDLIKVFGENRDFYFVFAFVSFSHIFHFWLSLSFRESESDFWFSTLSLCVIHLFRYWRWESEGFGWTSFFLGIRVGIVPVSKWTLLCNKIDGKFSDWFWPPFMVKRLGITWGLVLSTLTIIVGDDVTASVLMLKSSLMSSDSLPKV